MALCKERRLNWLAKMTPALTAAYTLSLLALSGCGGAGSASKTTGQQPLQVGIDFSRAETSAQLPATAQSVVVTVRDLNAFTDTRTLNRPPAESTISVVTAEFLALFNGNVSVNASAFSGLNGSGEKVAEAPVQTVSLSNGGKVRPQFTFVPAPYTRLQLLRGGNVVGEGLAVNVDTSTALGVRGVTAAGTTTDLNPTGIWSSSNTGVATVNAAGVITANNYGTSNITFTDGQNRTATVQVTVGGAVVNSVRFLPDITEIQQQATITAVALDSKNREITSNLAWRWETSNGGVVDINGGSAAIVGPASVAIRARGAGQASVTLTETNSGKSFSKTFNVVQLPQQTQ